MHIHYFQHVPFEGLGCIADWINQRGHQLSCTRWYEQQPDKLPEDIDWLIIMGGIMGVYEIDTYPWIKTELELIASAIRENKKVLGICLGAQLMASALGADVYPQNQKEIGWFPIDVSFQNQAATLDKVFPHHFPTFHFHGDMFDIPAGATRFAASAAGVHQAFILGDRTIGLQFHMEMKPENIEEIIGYNTAVLEAGGPFVQHADMIRQHFDLSSVNNEIMFRLLDHMAAL
ncbi:amidotransferase [Chitinophaga silvatica]|uniref:Amidotransferase n=1 Tax=Chitinophaga silvatica TaxID=2282649 RepID=A0A3E1YE28_9BACT|nr:gamma-glutamyl-gamma-aminobutyrate hydrolase family protein [Chitinophaga silvatica]RFS24830.1 amidotransferase [Chitinophaga silvatica]